MDELTYNYSYDGLGRLSHNRLGYVDDAASGSYSGDIEDQSSANYLYDASGRLIQDKLEKIENANSGEITWNNQNKVRKIKRGTASDVSDIEYKYNNMGQRAVKIVKPRTGGTESAETGWSYTYYVYDASGNVMATYERAFRAIAGGPSNDYNDIFTLSEHDIYGSSRLGLSKTQIEKTSTFTATLTATDPEGFTYFTAKSYSAVADTDDEHDESTTGIILYERTLGEKHYELTNHLENVAEVISDRKIQVPNGGNTATDYFIADVKSYSDFYAFHSLKPGRNFTSDDYRYSVNGQEKETEITGTASHSSAEYWMYDSRIGRRWEMDPMTYAWQSPYACFNNNPMLYIDPNGLKGKEPKFGDVRKKGKQYYMWDGTDWTSSAPAAVVRGKMEKTGLARLIEYSKRELAKIKHTIDERRRKIEKALAERNPDHIDWNIQFKVPKMDGRVLYGGGGVSVAGVGPSYGTYNIIIGGGGQGSGWWNPTVKISDNAFLNLDQAGSAKLEVTVAQAGAGPFTIDKSYWEKNPSNDLAKFTSGVISESSVGAGVVYTKISILDKRRSGMGEGSIWSLSFGGGYSGGASMGEAEPKTPMLKSDSNRVAANNCDLFGGDFIRYGIKNWGVGYRDSVVKYQSE